MSIALRKRPAEGVPTPSPSHLTFFVDENGNPSLKDSDGIVTPATGGAGPVSWQPTVSGAGTFLLAPNKINKYDSSAGAQIMTLQLPSNPRDGDVVTLQEIALSTNSITLDGNGNNLQDILDGSVVSSDSFGLIALSASYAWDAADNIWRRIQFSNMMA
jgi:hypothetical protein